MIFAFKLINPLKIKYLEVIFFSYENELLSNFSLQISKPGSLKKLNDSQTNNVKKVLILEEFYVLIFLEWQVAIYN